MDITLTVTLEGEGTVKVTVLTANGEKIIPEATNGNPAVITATVPLTIKKTLGDNFVERAAIGGIRLETVNGPAVGVQANIVINECTDYWCNKTHPFCQ